VNGNMAAMVANKEDLVRGARGAGTTVIMSNNKAIQAFREMPVTGAGGLKAVSSKSEGN
jgi:pilus assembly protein CpaD